MKIWLFSVLIALLLSMNAVIINWPGFAFPNKEYFKNIALKRANVVDLLNKDSLPRHEKNKIASINSFNRPIFAYYYQTGNYNKTTFLARQILENLENVIWENASIRLYLAFNFYKYKFCGNAIKTLNICMKENCQNNWMPNTLYLRARCYYNIKKYDESIADLRQLLSKYPTFDKMDAIYYILGLCYFQLKDYNQAFDHFSRLEELFPMSKYIPIAKVQIGYIYKSVLDYNECRKHCKLVVLQYPKTKWAEKCQLCIAQTYESPRGSWDAIKEYETLLSMNPSRKLEQEAIIKIAISYYQLGRFEIAANRLEEFLARFPDYCHNDIALYYLGKSYYKIDKYDAALLTLRKLKNKYSKSVWVVNAEMIMEKIINGLAVDK